jgi:dimethylhistidine N-methyltransferase
VTARGPGHGAAVTADADAADIVAGLARTPKQVPSRYLYDPLGLALFDAICELPWYGLMRAERRLLQRHAGDVFAAVPGVTRAIVLGTGSGEKLRVLLQGGGAPLEVEVIDFSAAALDRCARTLKNLTQVRVHRRRATYEAGLNQVAAQPRRAARTIAVFLGSNIGNSTPAEAAALLDRLRQTLAGGDALLLGADLVKPEPMLRLAYDDPLRVTAAFNRNLLVRLNRELGADFDLPNFDHEMRWDAAASRVEMHLRARRARTVRLSAIPAQLRIEAGESIWTESSYKYEPDQISGMLAAAGFTTRAQWIDREDRFALTLGVL